jgi:hypothetical protein
LGNHRGRLGAEWPGLLITYWAKGSRGVHIGFISYPGGQLYPLTKDTNVYQALTLSADGKTLAAVQQKYTQTLNILPATGGNAANPVFSQIKNPIGFGWAGGGGLYISDRTTLLRISADGFKKATLLSDPHALISWIRGCPGGRYIFLTWEGHLSNNVNIWRADFDGSNQKQLTDGKFDRNPACSPDGKWVYYIDSDAQQVKRVPTEGGTAETVPGTVMPNSLTGPVALSPDGKLLAFFVAKVGAASLEKRIAVVALDVVTKPVRMLDPDPREVALLGGLVEFTLNGDAVVYPIRENGTDNLWSQPLDGTQGRQITSFPADSIVQFQFSPDGKNLGVLREHNESDVVLLRDSGPSSE